MPSVIVTSNERCKVGNCCGCCDLRTGCIIIGSVHLIGMVVSFITSLCLFIVPLAIPAIIAAGLDSMYLAGVSRKKLVLIRVYWWSIILRSIALFILSGVLMCNIEYTEIPLILVLVACLVYMYFLLVIHSYSEYLLDPATSTTSSYIRQINEPATVPQPPVQPAVVIAGHLPGTVVPPQPTVQSAAVMPGNVTNNVVAAPPAFGYATVSSTDNYNAQMTQPQLQPQHQLQPHPQPYPTQPSAPNVFNPSPYNTNMHAANANVFADFPPPYSEIPKK